MFENETLLLRTVQGSSFVTKLCGLFTTKVSILMTASIPKWLHCIYISVLDLLKGNFSYLSPLEKKKEWLKYSNISLRSISVRLK